MATMQVGFGLNFTLPTFIKNFFNFLLGLGVTFRG